MPWAHLEPRPLLEDWLAARSLVGLRALDVGCGLGDNAEALARAGAHVVAFDLVERAVQWARERFPQSAVDYRVADLFDAPSEWRGAFDLVHELYTLQALARDASARRRAGARRLCRAGRNAARHFAGARRRRGAWRPAMAARASDSSRSPSTVFGWLRWRIFRQAAASRAIGAPSFVATRLGGERAAAVD